MEEIIKKIKINKKSNLNAIIHLPEDYHSHSDTEYPLILFLHGAGERGHNLELIKRYGIHPYLSIKNIPAIILSPQCGANYFWDKYLDDIVTLLDEMKKEYKVNHRKIYLIGISLGAYGAWNLAMQLPDLFAALVPIAGGAMLPQFSYMMKDIPVWAFHGLKDNVVPAEESIKAVNALKNAGGNVKLTLVEDHGHELCTKVFEREELYTWLFNQNKKF